MLKKMQQFLGRSFTIAVVLGLCPFIPAGGGLGQGAHQPDEKEGSSLESFLRAYLSDMQANDRTAAYFSAFVDLEDHGPQDVIVYFTSQHLCGSGGCATLILAPEGSSYRVVTRITIAWPPLRVLETRSHGWHDIAVGVQGGGIQPGYEAKLSFDGHTYPSNPTVPPSQRLRGKAAGKVVVPSDAKGKLLN
jgi:hypothetical protein